MKIQVKWTHFFAAKIWASEFVICSLLYCFFIFPKCQACAYILNWFITANLDVNSLATMLDQKLSLLENRQLSGVSCFPPPIIQQQIWSKLPFSHAYFSQLINASFEINIYIVSYPVLSPLQMLAHLIVNFYRCVPSLSSFYSRGTWG